MKYKLFIDSIILKIKYQSCNHEYDYNKVLAYLDKCGYVKAQSINKKYLNKFNAMYLHRDGYGKNLLEVYTLDSSENNKSIFFVYAMKYGIYIEINGIVQYEKDYRKDKLALIHKIWNKYNGCSINKLDIAIDIECKLRDINVYDKNLNLLKNSKKSNEGISYFLEGSYSKNNNKQRKLKAYNKSNQRFREFPLAMDLTRIEMTLKSQKLKGLANVEEMNARIMKELTHYVIHHQHQSLHILEDDVNEMCQSLFLILNTGKNSKKYSNFYKNIDTKMKSMRFAWESYFKKIPVREFVKHNPIAITVLKKYRNYYINR